MGKDFTLEHPDLDAAGTISGVGGGFTISDFGAERVQWHTALTIPFGPGNLCPAETAGAVDPHTQCAKTHRGLDRPFHRTAESNTAFQLLGDGFGNQLGINLRLANLNDVCLLYTSDAADKKSKR